METKLKTSLSKNGYKIKKSSLETKELQEIKRDLTVNPYVAGDFGNANEKKFSLFMESPNSIYIPKFYGLKKLGQPTKNNLNDGISIDIQFNGSLRDEQIPIVDLYMKSAREKGGGIISLKCGGGKTVLALNIISLINQKTIIVVHKDFLMNQWRERIQQFIPTARIGKIQQNTVDIEDKDIVLAMVQSLSMKEYPDETFQGFGLAIFDECHLLGAEIFSKSMRKVSSKYMLGLSATPNRKDGLRKVFEWYIGDLVYQTKEKNTDYI
jgi:superfamily II DNA or RNA helicase